MTARRLVSIITPTLNQAEFIEATLRSVATQDYDSIEHIVLDGGSTDETVQILRAWSLHPVIWSSQPDDGQADAIQRGLASATGEIVTWLNSDDIYLDPRVISDVVNAFASGASVVSGGGRYITANGDYLRRIRVERDRLDYSSLRCMDWVLQPATFIRSELFRRHPLDTRLHYAFDWDLFIRLARDETIVAIDRDLAGYRLHGNGKTEVGGRARRQELLLVTRRYNGRYSIRSMLLYAVTRLLDAADAMPERVGRPFGRVVRAFPRVAEVVLNGKGIQI